MKNIINRWYHPNGELSGNNTTTRNYYLDNLKFILILCVVVAHFALKLTYIKEIKYLLYFIYIFHMPCFIFINGYLAKRMNTGGRLRVDKIMVILWMYFLFKVGNYALGIFFGEKAELDLFVDKSAPWYLFALSIWYIAVPLLERIKTNYLIAGSFLIGLMVGYVGSVRDIFSLSRVFVFFPFFILGFCLTDKKLEDFLNKRLRIPAFLILTVVFSCFVLFWEHLSPVKDILYGSSPYKTSLDGLATYGFFIRGLWYLLVLIVALSVMLLVPRCKLFFSTLGERTMQVYMIHIWVRNALAYLGSFTLIKDGPGYLALLVLFGSVILTFVLSNRWFKILFDYLMSPKLFQILLKKEEPSRPELYVASVEDPMQQQQEVKEVV